MNIDSIMRIYIDVYQYRYNHMYSASMGTHYLNLEILICPYVYIYIHI
jgi:hypothetical protein